MKEAGVILAALLAASAVLSRSSRVAAYAAIGALILTPVLLLSEIWDSEQLRPLRDRPGLAIVLAGLGLAVIGAAVWLMGRRPFVFPVLAMVALPFRIPIAVAGTTSNLLVPLYLVIAAGTLAWAVPHLRSRGPDEERARSRWLEWALMGFVVLYAIQSTYSDDFDKALEQAVFFYVPFALLYASLREVEWTRRLLGICLGVLAALAVAFVGVGFWEYHSKELLLNPKVINANQFEAYFRVNSLFFDPNIYGRFLAIVMLGIAAVVLWTRRPRTAVVGGLLLALLWAGLVLTFSQSSFGGLLAGLAVLAALRWSARWTAVAVAAAVAVGAAFVLAAPGAVHLKLGDSSSANTATSGRVDLLEGGWELIRDKPLQGWGSASFSRAYRREQHVSSLKAVSASHTIPVTVAAEQGAPGLLLYLALVVLALVALLRGAGRSVARAAVAAAFVALLVHTMLYAAFLEDPLAWVLLAVGVALARGEPDGEPEPA